MRQHFKVHRGNSGSLRRSVSFLLACLFFSAVKPAVQRSEAAPITTANHYEWKQIKTQADIPAKGTYPMLLCYTDLNGNNWFLTGNSLRHDRELCRDGISEKKTGWAPVVRSRYEAWLKENGLSDSMDSISSYLKAYPSELRLITQYQAEPLTSGVNTNVMNATDAGGYPEIAISSESFFTRTLPSDWKMTVTGEKADGLKTIQITSGNKHLYDGWEVEWFDTMARIEWDDEDASSYSVYTTDVKSDRQIWTLDGCVQLFFYDGSLGEDTGLCWDYGYFGGIEDNNDHFSSFKLYYGVYKEFSVIDRDYVITDGSTLYANNDLELLTGVNLIIEPGGILCVNGVFLNNGVIHNCGTMVLDPGALVTTLEAKDPTCGQINCYGASMIEFAATHAGKALPGKQEYYSMSLSELERNIRYLEENLDWAARQKENMSDMIEYWTEEKDELEAVYQVRKYPTEAIQQLLKSMEGDEYVFSHCSGELIILEDAALLFADQPESRLNLYEGSVCSNGGLIVAPFGINVTGGELTNRENGHLFIGYRFRQAMGNDTKPKITNPGTASAGLYDLKADSGCSAYLDLSGKYHFRNDGTLLLCGLLSRKATDFEPGSRFFDRKSADNRKYYNW